jgi:hypothetical protein
MASPAVPILIGGFFAWSLYRRVRRNIGRQKLRPWRSMVSIIILSLVGFSFCFLSLGIAKLMIGIGGGILLGAALGVFGLRLTKFETTDEGRFYTPDTRIGVTLTLLFVGRMAYRIWAVRHMAAAPHSPPPFQSALTYFFFGLIAGYYVVYHIGLLSRSRQKKISADNA